MFRFFGFLNYSLHSLQSLLLFPILKSFFCHRKSPLSYILPPCPDCLVIYWTVKDTNLVFLELCWQFLFFIHKFFLSLCTFHFKDSVFLFITCYTETNWRKYLDLPPVLNCSSCSDFGKYWCLLSDSFICFI